MEGGYYNSHLGLFSANYKNIWHATVKTAAQQGVLQAAPPESMTSWSIFVIVWWRLDSLLLFSAIFPSEPFSYQTLAEKRGLMMNDVHQSGKTMKRIQLFEENAEDTDKKSK